MQSNRPVNPDAEEAPSSPTTEASPRIPWRLLRSCDLFVTNRQRELKDSAARHVRRHPESPAVGA
jgi:hypothetical protein